MSNPTTDSDFRRRRSGSGTIVVSMPAAICAAQTSPAASSSLRQPTFRVRSTEMTV